MSTPSAEGASLASLKAEAAKHGFQNLLPMELQLLKDFVTPPDLVKESPASTSADSDAATDAAEVLRNGAAWKRDRQVRAGLIRMLCVSTVAHAAADPKGLELGWARITGVLNLSSIKVPFPVTLGRCYFDAKLLLSQATIPNLDLSCSCVPGVEAELIVVQSNLYLSNLNLRRGQLNLRLSHITGNLDCSGAALLTGFASQKGLPDQAKIALAADGAIIDGYVLLRSTGEQRFHSQGAVRFFGAQIRGDFDCTDALLEEIFDLTFPDESDGAMTLVRAVVKGSVFLRGTFRSYGGVDLSDAQIGATLWCDHAQFENTRGYDRMALTLARTGIAGAANLTSARVNGSLGLQDSRIGGILSTHDANLVEATLDLRGATAAGIDDYGSYTWPGKNRLLLEDFQYGAIVGGTKKASERLWWLERQPDDSFNTECYTQLAKVLLQRGDDDGSRLVLEAMASRVARRAHPLAYLRPDIWALESVGFLYNPIGAIWYSLGFGMVGWIIYRRSYLSGTMMPTDKDAYTKLHDEGELPMSYPRLSALMMSVENSLPLVKLGQADKWQPDPGGLAAESTRVALKVPAAAPTSSPRVQAYTRLQMLQPLRSLISGVAVKTGLEPGPTGRSVPGALSRGGTSARFVRTFVWLQILLGWLFATLFVAGVSGLIKK